jgi:alkylhydroperoxidase/carboxymuconolactone decarboxylase family protein YurZ
MADKIFTEKTENLIAIGAAMAANCIPCFEHLYEKAITSGIAAQEIKRTAEIASQVKNGAHKAISATVEEITGPNETESLSLGKTGSGCCC